MPWAAPFVVFVLLTGIQPYVPGGVQWVYPLKTVLTALVIIYLRPWLKAEGPWALLTALVAGLIVLVLWVVPEYPFAPDSTPFNPWERFPRTAALVWIAFRLIGTALIVPIAEEFFWRGFLIRWLVKSDFRSVPMGTFTWYSFAATSVLFALEHDRWIAGLLAGIAYNLLWYRTKSLKACIVAHAVTNLGLGLYVLATGDWKFW